MYWEYIGATVIFIILGYLIGSISNAILISKIWKKEDIRDKDSGNAGATNVLRNYGVKFAMIVFALDISKVVLSVMIAWSIKKYSNIEFFEGGLIQAAGLAAIIGHILPIYFKFKGGKGAASFVGFTLVMGWPLFFVGLVAVITIIMIWKKVSLVSIIAPGFVFVFQIVFAFTPSMNDAWANPLMGDSAWWINSLFIGGAWLLVIFTHRENIKRIIKGTERSLNFKKKA